ncbi:hypothetical protein AB1Y20_017647 [Prymnesium parvum]|uniref:C5orf34-like C-terminal domain-containing protein n=1 Tax=Prymnesium parvum TaxID=97485 RepID=A0AB34JPX9_PRYPA
MDARRETMARNAVTHQPPVPHGSACLPAPALYDWPIMRRFLLLPDHSAQASFSDNSLIVLNATAACFVLVSGDATQLHGLTSNVTSMSRSRVAQAMHARNVLSSSLPRINWELVIEAVQPCHFFDSVSPMDTLCWPSKAVPAHVLRHSDGSVRVLSIDRRAWLLLHPQQHTFAVCFPVSAGAVDELPDPAAALMLAWSTPPPVPPSTLRGACRFVFCTQLHDAFAPVHPCWVHPIQLAQQVAQAASHRAPSSPTTAEGKAGRPDIPATHSPPRWQESEGEGWVPESQLLHVGEARDVPAPIHSSVAPLPFELSPLTTIDADAASSAVRTRLPHGAARDAALRETSPWKMENRRAEWLRALAADARSVELPEGGVDCLLTPYALYRMAGHQPLSMTVLEDGMRLALSSSRRFWESQNACPTAVAVTYAVGAVPPTRRYIAALAPSSHPPGNQPHTAPPTVPTCTRVALRSRTSPLSTVSLLELASLGEALLPRNEQRRLAYTQRCAARSARWSGVESDPPPCGCHYDPKHEARCGRGSAAQVVEEALVPAVGRFRLFGDGRVSVAFEDRTIVTMRRKGDANLLGSEEAEGQRAVPPPTWRVCDITFPDGHTTQVRSDLPIGGEEYVRAAVKFHTWATQSPAERASLASQLLKEQLAVDAELKRIDRHFRLSSMPLPTSVTAHRPTSSRLDGTLPQLASPLHLQVSLELAKLEHALSSTGSCASPASVTFKNISHEPKKGASTNPGNMVRMLSFTDALSEIDRISQLLHVLGAD